MSLFIDAINLSEVSARFITNDFDLDVPFSGWCKTKGDAIPKNAPNGMSSWGIYKYIRLDDKNNSLTSTAIEIAISLDQPDGKTNMHDPTPAMWIRTNTYSKWNNWKKYF